MGRAGRAAEKGRALYLINPVITLVAGGHRRAKQHQTAINSKGSVRPAVGVGAGTSRNGNKVKCFIFERVGHLLHQCPSRAGANLSRGKQSLRLPVKCQHGGIIWQQGQEAAAANETPKGRTVGRRRQSAGKPGCIHLRDHHCGMQEGKAPHHDIGTYAPNKQATGSIRISLAAVVEGGEPVVLVNLEGAELAKEGAHKGRPQTPG